jgi:hypothetical protein
MGLSVSEYQYLGFGGFKFYDFEMLFRHLGIREMTSLEADGTLFARCEFNKPFDFIDVRKEWLSKYLRKVRFKRPVMAWLDFDSPLSSNITDDIESICAKAPLGSFVFVTIDARMPEGLQRLLPDERIASLKEEFLGLALGPSSSDVELSNFAAYADRVLWASLTSALGKRSDGEFVPLMRVFYSDTTLMLTAGGCLCPAAVARPLADKMREEFPFLLPRNSRAETFTIPVGNFTIKERHLLDAVVTGKKVAKTNKKKLRSLGFTAPILDDYTKLVRFLPKYIETYL